MRASSTWAAFQVRKKSVIRESEMSRVTEHSREEIVMDREEEVRVVDNAGTVTVVVVVHDTTVEHMDIVMARPGEAHSPQQVVAAAWRDRT